MRESESSGMEFLFSFGILIGWREDVLFQCGFVHLQTYEL